MVAGLVLLLAFVMAFFALAPAYFLGRSQDQGGQRKVAALIVALLLNTVAFLLSSRMSYGIIFAIPSFCFCIAAIVAGVVARRAWLFGILASPWFVAPFVVDWFKTATPDQIAAYGRIPWSMVTMTLPFSVAGAIAAEVALSMSRAGSSGLTSKDENSVN